LFVNDIANEVALESDENIVKIQGIPINMVLFADDTVLFSKSPESLQKLLDKLHLYCKKWNLKVNVNKTKVVVFENRNSNTKFEWKYADKIVEIVDSYVYLGILMYKTGNFNYTQKRLSEQGNRALMSMMGNLRNHFISTEKQCEIFDIMVGSILTYACEVWGHCQANDIEIIHNKFCKMLLSANKTSPTVALLGDLGRKSMIHKRQEKQICYWLKTLQNPGTLSHRIYVTLLNDANNGKTNWASKLRDILIDLGLNNYWISQDPSSISLDIIKQRLSDQCIQAWRAKITASPKLELYCKFKNMYTFEKYLCLEKYQVSILYRFRSSGLQLGVETGRYENIPREQRICKLCNMKVIENEYHFLLICPKYSILRKKYLPKYYIQWPNINKFCSLINSDSLSKLKKVSLFLTHAYTIRCQENL
jgi:hypothetical protein